MLAFLRQDASVGPPEVIVEAPTPLGTAVPTVLQAHGPGDLVLRAGGRVSGEGVVTVIYDGVVTRARISSVDGWVLPEDASPRPVRIACATGSCQLVFDLWDLVRFTRFTGSSVEIPMVITGELEGRGIFRATTGVRVTVELDER